MSMTSTAEALIKRLLRTYKGIFSASDFAKVLTRLGVKTSVRDSTQYLESSQCVFPLKKRLYQTRAGAFTGACFSFKPTREELAKKVFVAGDRCLPFVDSDMLSNSLIFNYKGKQLKQRVIECTNYAAEDLFFLYGEEYASQYIAADPANSTLDLAQQDFELPQKVHLTAFSIEPILKDCDFRYGDRFLCTIKDWDNGVIEIVPLQSHKEDVIQIERADIDRRGWYTILEKFLIDDFSLMGPCGSIEESLQYFKKVDIEIFGVESRLWFAGRDVPAIGTWNAVAADDNYCSEEDFDFAVPDYLLDSFLKDCLYEKKDDINAIVAKIIPRNFSMTSDERNYLMLQITHRNAILLKTYNWFADFVTGTIRHRALELYSSISKLVYDIDGIGNDLTGFPQQELVILSQLFNHITRILDSIENDSASVIDDSDAVMLSLEGMEENFEDIKEKLSEAVEEERKNGFIVIN